MTMAIHDKVFKAALDYIKSNATQVKVYKSSTLVKSDAISSDLDASNFGAIGDYASGGRQMQCCVSHSSDMKNIGSLSAGSSINNIRLVNGSDSSAVLVQAEVSSTNVGASDAINLGTFYVIFKDPA